MIRKIFVLLNGSEFWASHTRETESWSGGWFVRGTDPSDADASSVPTDAFIPYSAVARIDFPQSQLTFPED